MEFKKVNQEEKKVVGVKQDEQNQRERGWQKKSGEM